MNHNQKEGRPAAASGAAHDNESASSIAGSTDSSGPHQGAGAADGVIDFTRTFAHIRGEKMPPKSRPDSVDPVDLTPMLDHIPRGGKPSRHTTDVAADSDNAVASLLARTRGEDRRKPATPAPLSPASSNGDLCRARRYAEAALRDEAQNVATAPEGTRNHTLNAAAFKLARFVNDGHLAWTEVYQTLAAAGRACGLDDGEIETCLKGDRHLQSAADKLGDRPAVPPADPAYTTESLGNTTFDPGGLGGQHADGGGDELFEMAVKRRMHELRVGSIAQQRFQAEQRPPTPMPPVRGLDAMLAEPDEVTPFRIEQVMPISARVLVAAPAKAGKTHLLGNLIRSLADGDQFLGRFAVRTRAERIVLIDDELNDNMVRAWLRDQRIRNTSAIVDVVTLRGRLSAFDLFDDKRRDQWAARFRDLGVDYLALDCLRPLLDAFGLDEHREFGRFAVVFDELLRDAGVDDAAVVHHMGHGAERARGDSRIQDWPDALWKIVREDPDDPHSPRYFSASGRDVQVLESRLALDGRHLTVVGGSRKSSKAEAAARAVVAELAKVGTALSKNAIEQSVASDAHSRASVRAGIKLATKHKLLIEQPGDRGAKLHAVNHPCEQCGLPVASKRSRHESCPSSADELVVDSDA